MHKLLERQLRRYLKAGHDSAIAEDILRVISHAYEDHDVERTLLEQSLAQVSDELKERNGLLKVQLEEIQSADSRLRRSLSMIDSILEATSEAIFAFDHEGNLIRMNRAARDLVGIHTESEYECSNQVGTMLDEIFQYSAKYAKERHLLSKDETAAIKGSLTMDNGQHLEYYSSPQYSDAKVIGRVWCFRDITALKANEELIKFQAQHDSLTGLPNRLLLQNRLHHAISHRERLRSNLAVLFLDLDLFKRINDSVGHLIGDRLLQDVSYRIQGCLRSCDTLARFGGDEFIILLEHFDNVEAIGKICERILAATKNPFEIEQHTFYVTCSIGISLYSPDNIDPQLLVRQADLAMYHAKTNGRNRYEFFDPELESRVQSQLIIETRLRAALQNEEFSVYFQPKVNLKTGKISAMEALIRWFPPGQPAIRPGEFIPIAERSGLIASLDRWVLKQVCRQLRGWNTMQFSDLSVSVNLSAQQFQDPALVEKINHIIETENIPACCIEFEVTETLLMENFDVAIDALKQLKALGFKLSIDDFGTGYSSLQYLKKLPIDTLKIDRCFIRDIEENPNDQSIVDAIVSLGHNLNLTVVAEGAEKKAAIDYLRQCQCDFVQGFYYYQPMPADELTQILQRQAAS